MGLLLAAWPRINVMWSNFLRREDLSLKDALIKLLEDAEVHGRNSCAGQTSQRKLFLCGPDIVYMKGKRHVLTMAV